MKLRLKKINFYAGRPIVFIHESIAKKLDIHPGDRIELSYKNKKTISVVDTATGILSEKELFLSKEVAEYFNIAPGSNIDINATTEPASLDFISKKMNGHELSKKEIYTIVRDIVNNALTEAEISYFILGVYEKGMTLRETINLTEAMCNTGQVLKWPKNYAVADKHCIGGIPGNRTTPIVVSICASYGVVMPKTSSRAITSAAGTADTIETMCKVDFSIEDLKKIVAKTGACLAWGGSLGLSPADDKLIRVEKILNLDPESQLLASIISKKLAVGSKYILIDIPYGNGAKVNFAEAKKLKNKFLKIALHFNLKMKVILTNGSEPIGYGVGPVLEMLDVLKVLKREDSPKDLEVKSIMLAGEIFELVGKAKPGKGSELALNLLNSKKALSKFEEILSAQGRKKSPLKLARFKYVIKSNKQGKIINIDSKLINHIARILGCPVDKGSGIYLNKHAKENVVKNEVLATFYSESKKKLEDALKNYHLHKPISIK